MANRTLRSTASNPIQPPASAPGPDFDLSFLPASENLAAGTPGPIDDLAGAPPLYPAPAQDSSSFLQTPYYGLPPNILAPRSDPVDKRKLDPDSSERDTDGKKLKVLAKNRASARESRRRKKEYVTTLEARIAELEAELDASRAATNNYSRLQINSARVKLMESLKPLLKEGAPEDQLNPIIDELTKLNSSFTSPSIDYHIQKINELLQPYSLMKFLLWALSQGDNFYREDSNGNYNGVFGVLNKAIGFTAQQRDQLKSMRDLARPQVQGMQMLSAHLRKLAEIVHAQLQQNDNLLKQLRSFTTPLQHAKFILWAEQNEACMQVVETIWNENASSISADPLIETPILPQITSPATVVVNESHSTPVYSDTRK